MLYIYNFKNITAAKISIFLKSSAIVIVFALFSMLIVSRASKTFAQPEQNTEKQKRKTAAVSNPKRSVKKQQTDKTNTKIEKNNRTQINKIDETIKKLSAAESLEITLSNHVDINMRTLINETAAKMMQEKNGPENNVKFTVYFSAFDGDSNELRVIFTKTYNKSISIKSEYGLKYNSKNYFTFESDLSGFKGYQITSKIGVKPALDMVCYQCETDSVFLACTLAPAGTKTRPRLIAEGGFLRGAIISAKEFKDECEYTFFKNAALRSYRPKKGSESISATGSISYMNETPLIYIYTYKNRESAAAAFVNFKLTRGALKRINEIKQKDNEYIYYLNAPHILAVSNKL